MTNKYSISIIGAGNVGTHLALHLYAVGFPILNICNRRSKWAKELAQKVNAQYVSSVSALNTAADVYIIAVPDEAIVPVAHELSFLKDKMVLHTSGTTSLELLAHCFNNAGVLYPLQTFNKERKLNFSSVPFFVEGTNAPSLKIVSVLAESLSEKVYHYSSEQRKFLHMAAVFVCNFVNYMYTLGTDLLGENRMDASVLNSLIQETADKIIDHPPAEVQTGPAKRNDIKTMQQHLELLNDFPEMKEVYALLSAQIVNRYTAEK